MPAFIDTPGFGEILMILFVALLVYGGKLPDVAREIGKNLSHLKKNVETFKGEIEKEVSEPPPPSEAAAKPPEIPPPEKPKSST